MKDTSWVLEIDRLSNELGKASYHLNELQAVRISSKKNIAAANKGTIQEKTTIYCHLCIYIHVCEKVTGRKFYNRYKEGTSDSWTITSV